MKVKIDKHIYTNDKIKKIRDSKIIYIPLISGSDTDISILVTKDEYVYKGSIIGKRKGDFRIPIYSSVSGKVLGFEEKIIYNGNKVKCVKIENDFKEKIVNKIMVKKELSNYTKQEFIEKLRENGIVGLGGAGFPTYLKYTGNLDLLIVNAVECEPYLTTDETLLVEKCEEILETIDAILEINSIKKAIIAIRKNSSLKKILENFIGTYLKIELKIIDDYYPNGWERILIKKLTNKEYKIYPSEIKIVVNNVSTIYAIYEALKYNKPLIERVVTFTGENLLQKENLLVKIGTPVKDIIEKLKIKENSIIISGGPLMGKKLDDFIISANTNCVLVLENLKQITSKCINCGKCISVCPLKLSPILIQKNINNNNLKQLHPEKCMECGLCSYVCPAKIDVRKYVIEAKKKVGSDK